MFKFKQFNIYQDRCAMKVCTDACVFGAHIPIKTNDKILDIGTGTGLLSLMLAQKKDCQIDAVEIDHSAFIQAGENVKGSPFQNRINLFPLDVNDFKGDHYDLIICNPPFFDNNLVSPNEKKNKAKHQSNLKLSELAKNISLRLKPEGRAAIMLPSLEMNNMKSMLSAFEFNAFDTLKLKHRMDTKIFREIVQFSRIIKGNKEKTLCIRKADNVSFTDDFQLLLKDYYNIF